MLFVIKCCVYYSYNNLFLYSNLAVTEKKLCKLIVCSGYDPITLIWLSTNSMTRYHLSVSYIHKLYKGFNLMIT